MPSGPGNPVRVAIVGASTLRGKELKQVLEDRNFPALDIVLLDESLMVGTLTEAGGEPTFIRALEADSFDGLRFAFFAGSSLDAEKNWSAAQRAGATVIDLAGAAATSDRASTWIPSLGEILPPLPAKATNGSAQALCYSSPQTPIIIACTLAAALANSSPARVTILLFPPVSERDQAGVDELEAQTMNLLSFRPIEQSVFDAQVAFNLLSGYGESSKPSLEEARNAIARDVAKYLAGRAPIPAIQVVQAPVFYGYAFSAYAEFATPQPQGQLEAQLASLGVKIAAPDDPAPMNVSIAGESEIHLARITNDPNIAGGVWLWGVADNLRLAATNGVRIAEELLAQAAV
jgi:aspartate-semialdehyde dehydrogenase